MILCPSFFSFYLLLFAFPYTKISVNIILKDSKVFHLWIFHDLFNPIAEHTACFQYMMSIYAVSIFCILDHLFFIVDASPVFTTEEPKGMDSCGHLA